MKGLMNGLVSEKINKYRISRFSSFDNVMITNLLVKVEIIAKFNI